VATCPREKIVMEERDFRLERRRMKESKEGRKPV
jgi:hypothetical protein